MEMTTITQSKKENYTKPIITQITVDNVQPEVLACCTGVGEGQEAPFDVCCDFQGECSNEPLSGWKKLLE